MLAIYVLVATQLAKAHSAPLDADTGRICAECDAGDDWSCERLVRLDKRHRTNVCHVRTDTGGGQYASPGEVNENYFEGDIYQPPDVVGRRDVAYAALRGANRRWSGGVMPYEIAGNFKRADRSMIKAAINHIEEKTCVRLKRRTNEKDYVQFTNARDGCYSDVGRRGGRQTLNLDTSYNSNCLATLGTPVHEILHALGFVHEHTRPDRDKYVTVHLSNIETGMRNNFQIVPSRTVDTAGTPYDYGSVMHYGAYFFAVDRRHPTLSAKQRGVILGQRDGLSRTDVAEVNAAYRDCGRPSARTTRRTTRRPRRSKTRRPRRSKTRRPRRSKTRRPREVRGKGLV